MSKSTDIFELIDSGNIDAIENYMISYSNFMNNSKLIHSFALNPLQYTSMIGNFRIVELFISSGVPVDQSCHYNHTALHFAALFGYYNIVNYLIQNGANVNAKNTVYKSPLTYALIYGNECGIDLALNNTLHSFNLKKVFESQQSTIFNRSYDEIVKLLISKGAKPSQDDILIAISCGGVELIKSIQSQYPRFFNAVTSNTRCELIKLVKNNAELQKSLIFNGIMNHKHILKLYKENKISKNALVNYYIYDQSSLDELTIDYISSYIDEEILNKS